MKLNKYCETKLSNIHGRGVFARRDIKKGTDIIEYQGEIVSKEEGDKRTDEQEKKGAIYIFSLNKKQDIDGSIKGSGAELINHSCHPNAEAINYDDEEICIRAIKNIKKGEEITYDYGFIHDIDCNCGHPKCKGKF